MSAALPSQVFEPIRGHRVIEAQAWACLERCQRKLGLDDIPLPVPIDEWIEGPLGIRFGITDLSYLGKDVLGGAFVQEREILIDQRVLEHEGRFRFTCAHELGHLTLHRRVSGIFHETEAMGPGSAHRIEREADRFAAAFLMPLPLLERELLRLLDEAGLNRTKCIARMMYATPESEWLWRRRLLPALIERFGVSLSAAVFRCREIQPRIHLAIPLLPPDLADRLTRPPRDLGRLDAIQVMDGVPVRCDLFSHVERADATQGSAT